MSDLYNQDYTHHIFVRLMTGDGPFVRMSLFQSKFMGRVQRIGFDVVATTVLHDGSLLVTMALPIERGQFDFDAALEGVEAADLERERLAELRREIDEVGADIEVDFWQLDQEPGGGKES